MTTRFGLSGATLGVVAGVSVGLAGLIGWQYMRPLAAPEPPLAQTSSPPAAAMPPSMARPSVAAPGLMAGGASGSSTGPSTGAASPSGLAAPGATNLGAADSSSEAADLSLPEAAGGAAAMDKALNPAQAVAPAQPEARSALPEVPQFDTFRLGEDGTAVLAGVASGALEVVVLVDAIEVARARPAGNGRFAAIFSLDPSSAPRMLSLLALGRAGEEVASADSILLPPRIGRIAAAAGSAPGRASEVATSDASGGPVAATEASPPVARADLRAGSEASEGAGGASMTGDAGANTTVGASAATSAAQGQGTSPPPAAMEIAAASAPSAPSPLLLTEGGARKLGAQSDGRLAIDTITYAESGAVSVAGRGLAGHALRLYLDNAPKLDTQIDGDGHWQGELMDVRPGLYTLRADQMDEGGKVLARSETPFLREAAEALAAAAADPAAGTAAAPLAQVVTVQPGYTLWGIAKTTYGSGMSYVQVFEANRGQIRNPDLIYPGQVFSLPRPD